MTTAVVTPTSSITAEGAGASRQESTTASSASLPLPRSLVTASASPQKTLPPPIITHQLSPPSRELQSPWRLEVAVEGTKQCLIVGFVVNIIAMKCLASEHVLGKLVVCSLATVGYVLSIYNPRPRFAAPTPMTAGHLGARGFAHHGGFGVDEQRVDAAVLSTEVGCCENPMMCCLHRAIAGSPGTTGGDERALEGDAHDGMQYSGIAAGAGRALNKFKMGSSMTQTTMNESGRSMNVPHSWATTRGETFSVRSLDYKKTKRKEVRVWSWCCLLYQYGSERLRADDF